MRYHQNDQPSYLNTLVDSFIGVKYVSKVFYAASKQRSVIERTSLPTAMTKTARYVLLYGLESLLLPIKDEYVPTTFQMARGKQGHKPRKTANQRKIKQRKKEEKSRKYSERSSTY